MKDTHKLIEKITDKEIKLAKLEQELINMKAQLQNIQEHCQHEYDDYTYTPEIIEYNKTDRHYQIPPKIVDKWSKTCQYCGKTETTTNINIIEKLLKVRTRK